MRSLSSNGTEGMCLNLHSCSTNRHQSHVSGFREKYQLRRFKFPGAYPDTVETENHISELTIPLSEYTHTAKNTDPNVMWYLPRNKWQLDILETLRRQEHTVQIPPKPFRPQAQSSLLSCFLENLHSSVPWGPLSPPLLNCRLCRLGSGGGWAGKREQRCCPFRHALPGFGWIRKELDTKPPYAAPCLGWQEVRTAFREEGQKGRTVCFILTQKGWDFN